MPPDDDERSTAFSPRAFRRSLRRAGITATQYRVAVELCEYASQGRSVVWPSIAVLAKDCELGRSTVIRALNQLEEDGFIVCDDGRKGGRGRSTRRRLIVKSVTYDTLRDGERVSSKTKRVSNQGENGVTGDTRSSYKKGEEEGAADAAHTPPLVSLDGRPRDCCPEHEPDSAENCDACLHAWRKAESWEYGRPRSWSEYVEELTSFSIRAEWVAQGPPRFCERDHAVGAPCNTCRDLRLLREEWAKRHALWEQDCKDWRKDIADCQMCDNTGHVWIGDDPDPWWCDHGWLDPPLSSYGTVSSVPPVKCEAVSDSLAGHAIHSRPDISDTYASDSDDDGIKEWMADSDTDDTERWVEYMADSDGVDTAAPPRAGSEQT